MCLVQSPTAACYLLTFRKPSHFRVMYYVRYVSIAKGEGAFLFHNYFSDPLDLLSYFQTKLKKLFYVYGEVSYTGNVFHFSETLLSS